MLPCRRQSLVLTKILMPLSKHAMSFIQESLTAWGTCYAQFKNFLFHEISRMGRPPILRTQEEIKEKIALLEVISTSNKNALTKTVSICSDHIIGVPSCKLSSLICWQSIQRLCSILATSLCCIFLPETTFLCFVAKNIHNLFPVLESTIFYYLMMVI